MAIVFDPVKRLATLEQRGLDFARLGEIFDGAHLTIEDKRLEYCETRYFTVGLLDARMVVAVWTPRDGDQRVMSKANDREQKSMARGSSLSDEDDAPDLSQSPWAEKLGAATVQRGRPRSEKPKVSTTIRLDADILDGFRAEGPGWQSRINDALRDWLARRDR